MLYFLYGEDSFRSKEKLHELKKVFLKKNPPSGLFVFDFSDKDTSEQAFLEALKSGGLFSEKKLIIAEGLLKNIPTERQKTVLEKLKTDKSLSQEKDLVLVFHEEGQPKKNLSFYKYLSTNAKKQEFSLLSPRDLENWASGYVAKSSPQTAVPAESLSMLVSYVGNDLYLLKNELDKLICFKAKGGEISKNDIEALVKSHSESTVFQAIEALLGKDAKRALFLLHEQLQKGEDPFYLLSMYSYQLRTLLKISAAFESGNTNPQFIAKETGIHPYVVQKAFPQIKNISFQKLRDIYGKLGEIDMASKTGKNNVTLLLDKLISSL
ncbi:MAG: polymerase III, delta subunit protein [Candidatus Moranbacteria bacterium GW2011_GWE1_49_15]|nr:MAG: polymerase III, delta subunit protein [Candidatus Moranbacteria bacterium GW2011_GWE2_47_10]KKW07353.1 MAG: polymerase III, delta subunit protein [Candidatus Moranbacteria bacterium GW2011_GWE1_49_15]